MASILITGGAGFIGSHAALRFREAGWTVRVLDNLSRGRLLHKEDPNSRYNWDRLSRQSGIELIEGDVRDAGTVEDAVQGMDAVLHAAAQTAVTTSTLDPATDFETNAVGTFRVLDAIRRAGARATFLYCSTNKVYGERVNGVPLQEEPSRYRFGGELQAGIPEEFGTDLCEHTPYGCSKLTGDLYAQDFGHLYGVRVGVFRMSCIFGTHQFGLEDQGWVAWFTIAAVTGAPLTIYGDGKQVRDVLWADDLIDVYQAFLDRGPQIGVYNIGGGAANTLSLRELLQQLGQELGHAISPATGDWRPSDQKVYVSDIRKAERELGWTPGISPQEGVSRLLAWVRDNRPLFRHFEPSS